MAESTVEDPPQRWVVQGSLRGPLPRDVELTAFRVRQRHGSEWVTLGVALPKRVDPSGAYRIDVTQLFRERQAPDELEVTADHRSFTPSTAAIDVNQGELVRATDDTIERVFVADIIVPSTAVITGRVFALIGHPDLVCRVSVHRLREGRRPTRPDDEWTEISEGEFSLRVTQAGPVVVLAQTDASRPSTVHAEAVLGEERSVGKIQLDLGATICGSVQSPEKDGTPWIVTGALRGKRAARTGELEWIEDRYRRVATSAQADPEGNFCLSGFEIGDEVELPPAGCGPGVQVRIATCGQGEDEAVLAIAPASDVHLKLLCGSVRIHVEGVDPMIESIPFSLKAPNHTMQGTTNEPRSFVVGGCPGTQVRIELAPPGYPPWSGEYTLPEAGTSIYQTIQMKR